MKKKIVSLCLVVVMAAIAIVGGTLAYLTDKDQVKNTFTVGNIDIDLYEKTEQYGDKEFQEFLDYSNIMPGDALSKEPYVRNESKVNAAYVRVTVVLNHLNEIDKAIDKVYEKAGKTPEEIQAIYDHIFDGWGVNYNKLETNGRRLCMDEREEVLCNIDMIGKPEDSYAMVDMRNAFQTAEEKAKFAAYHDGILNVTQGDPEGYYWNAVKADERAYVFYLLLQPGEQYKLFDGLNVPADFTAEQLNAMFEGLEINIYADAIQADGFDSYVDAFNALNEAHPIGWWND